ncbi:MAG: hypothetical protein Q4F40_06700 [Akkermansia sp.]|nr:hypothetical protein [Akkermansia sp.]
MKKFFSLCTAVSVLLTGLVSCGGGGDENRGFVTATDFRAGTGFKLLQNPQFEIVAGYSGDVEGNWPTDSNGNPAIPPLIIPGTGQDEIVDDPNTEENEGQDYIPPTQLTPVGTMAIVNRTVKAGGSIAGNFDITYCMTAEDIGVATLSTKSPALLANKTLLTGLGIAAETNTGNWNNNNADNDTLNRVSLENLEACDVKIYFDFKTGQATVIISATGVQTDNPDDDTNELQASSVVISAASVPFLVTH